MRFGKKGDVRFQLCIKPSGFLVDGCNLVSPVRGAEYEQILRETGDLICTGWANMHMGWGYGENKTSQLKSPLNNIVFFTSTESDFRRRKSFMDGIRTPISVLCL